MREIKFRAWFPGPNVMGDVTNLKGSNVNYIFDGVVAECFISGKQVFYEAYKNFVLMQFTGLRDREGKEIYEGDIVRYEMPGPPPEDLMIEYIEPITFSVASFDVEGAPLYVVNEVCEVIGNIYENPELLK